MKWEDTPVDISNELVDKVLAYIREADPAFWPSVTATEKWYSNLREAKPRIAEYVIESRASTKLRDWSKLNFRIFQLAYLEGLSKNGEPTPGGN